jgi:hypothetical protein
MLSLTRAQIVTLRTWFLPERPGPLVGSHVINSGHGGCWVDDWPQTRAVLAETGGNYSISGDPRALAADSLQPHVRGFVDADAAFAPLLYSAFPDLQVWQRVIFAPLAEPPPIPQADCLIRRLAPTDAPQLRSLDEASAWISKSWGGAEGLASSGYGWGAFVDGQLAAVACTFFLGMEHEDIGVVTVPAHRRRGLSSGCAAALCRDIFARGRRPTWATSPDNVASLRVAEKLGFAVHRSDVAYVVGTQIPQ